MVLQLLKDEFTLAMALSGELASTTYMIHQSCMGDSHTLYIL